MKHAAENQDFRPTATWDTLRRRAEVIRRIRVFFDALGFVEVETPLLSHDIVVDRHLHPISIDKSQVTGASRDRGQTLWLQTSPEFAMKRLVAAGAPAIYQICKAFRCGEQGSRHNPEFTMLEWYRAGDNLDLGMQLLGQFVQTVLSTRSPKRLTYRDALLAFADVDPYNASNSELHICAGIDPSEGQDRDELLNRILSDRVEPQLGRPEPVILYEFPASQAALARIRNEPHPVAERFEIYVDGIELANGYHELLEARELETRNERVNAQRISDGYPPLPEASRLLDAMRSGLPACAGAALGIDRLIMLAMQLDDIRDVIAFPLDRA